MNEKTTTSNRWIPQNLGWLDRLIRFIIGTAIITVSLTTLVFFTAPVWLEVGTKVPSWPYYAPIVAIYFFITAIYGACPLYGLFGIRSCGRSPRNPCGTFPFEIDAAIGHHPIPDSEIEHSLEASHHEKAGGAKT
ncbi:YgaP family membrane protein [Kaarinaea lacus]